MNYTDTIVIHKENVNNHKLFFKLNKNCNHGIYCVYLTTAQ